MVSYPWDNIGFRPRLSDSFFDNITSYSWKHIWCPRDYSHLQDDSLKTWFTYLGSKPDIIPWVKLDMFLAIARNHEVRYFFVKSPASPYIKIRCLMALARASAWAGRRLPVYFVDPTYGYYIMGGNRPSSAVSSHIGPSGKDVSTRVWRRRVAVWVSIRRIRLWTPSWPCPVLFLFVSYHSRRIESFHDQGGFCATRDVFWIIYW